MAKQEKITEQQFSQVKQIVDKQEKKTEQLSSLRHKLQADVETKLHRHDQEVAYKALIDKAFSNRNNLVVTGLSEDDDTSAVSQISKFFKDHLKLDRLSLATAYRLGKVPRQGSAYSRPILVKFKHNSDRNVVWKKRKDIKKRQGG